MLVRVVLSLSIVVACAAVSRAQQAVEYTVSIPHPDQRWLQVDARFPVKPGEPIEVRMARSSPGRYAPHEFGKNVYMFEAVGDAGARPAAEPVGPAQWRITARSAVAHVRYRLFADQVDGTYAAVDRTHAHLNAPATFVFAPALAEAPVRVTLRQPDGRSWKVATQLYPTSDPLTFTAPNQQYFLDSPIEFSDHAVREFTVEQPGGAARIRLAVHHLGTDAELDAYTARIEAIVREQAAIFGQLPAFETGTYTFLMDYLPWADGDGMEHRNSTVCTAPAALAGSQERLASTAAHEFFHVWNVERIRPASLEPFDFTRPNMSGDLWFAEGFTTYYASLTMIRAGLVAPDAGVAQMSGYVNTALLSPGTRFRSAVEMSRLAPYVDAATAVDPTNWENTYASYYPYGAAIGLGLDLLLRERSDGRVTLDDYMRRLWTTHGAPGGSVPGLVARPYTSADLEAALAATSGDAAFARGFFARHVMGTEPLPFERLLAGVGYELRPLGTPWLGILELQPRDAASVVANNPVATSAVHRAGVGRGDAIVSLNGTPIGKPGDWERVVSTLTVGDEVELVFESRGERQVARVTVQANPRLTLRPLSQPTPRQLAQRDAWLRSRR